MFLKEEKIVPIVIDLTESKKNQLNESFLAMLGGGVEMLLKRMFGAPSVPVTVKGSESQLSTFADALVREKKYMDSYIKNGLANPTTMRSKHSLDKAVANFETETGLKWPLA